MKKMMKKQCLLLLALLFLPALARAEGAAMGTLLRVVRCNEFITFREEPNRKAKKIGELPLGALVMATGETEGDFAEVFSRGQTGWALAEYFDAEPEEGEPYEPTTAEQMNLNLFLTTFTRVYLAPYRLGEGTEGQLIDFAVDYSWFYRHDKLEFGEWGEDNTRLSTDGLPEIAERFFGLKPVNLSASRFTLRSGFFYWQDTGGYLNGGFAVAEEVQDLGEGRLGVTFAVFGGGEDWEPEGVCLLTRKQALAAYPHSGEGQGYAIVRTNGSDTPEDWHLERYLCR